MMGLIVLAVVEQCGCSCRQRFGDGIRDVFGSDIDSIWHSKIHNGI